MANLRFVTVTIPAASIDAENITQYHVEVATGFSAEPHLLTHRYSQFRALSSMLQLPAARDDPPFPRRHRGLTLAGLSQSASFISQRRLQLEAWLQHVVRHIGGAGAAERGLAVGESVQFRPDDEPAWDGQTWYGQTGGDCWLDGVIVDIIHSDEDHQICVVRYINEADGAIHERSTSAERIRRQFVAEEAAAATVVNVELVRFLGLQLYEDDVSAPVDEPDSPPPWPSPLPPRQYSPEPAAEPDENFSAAAGLTPFVLDMGSFDLKHGITAAAVPHVTPTLVGRERQGQEWVGLDAGARHRHILGQEALDMAAVMDTHAAVADGVGRDLGGVEALCEQVRSTKSLKAMLSFVETRTNTTYTSARLRQGV